MEYISGTVSRTAANVFALSAVRLILAGVYRRSLAERLPIALFHRIIQPGGMKPEKVRKLHENLFYAIWHTLSFTLVMGALLKRPWFRLYRDSWDAGHAYYEFPHELNAEEESLYLYELGFWISCLAFLTVETIRKDAMEMALHHAATIGLIAISHMHGFNRFGFLVLAIHDVGDIFLYSAKFFNYLGYSLLTNILFGTFVVVFFLSRLVIFPSVIWVTWTPILGYIEGINWRTQSGSIILPSLLLVLQLLHVMWFVLIIKMVVNMFKNEKKQVEGDIRSEDEGTSPEVTTIVNETTKKNI
jgi:hypothetical protein